MGDWHPVKNFKVVTFCRWWVSWYLPDDKGYNIVYLAFISTARNVTYQPISIFPPRIFLILLSTNLHNHLLQYVYLLNLHICCAGVNEPLSRYLRKRNQPTEHCLSRGCTGTGTGTARKSTVRLGIGPSCFLSCNGILETWSCKKQPWLSGVAVWRSPLRHLHLLSAPCRKKEFQG